MSTKTTFKRVALVAVAALGLGVLSVAPSSAAASNVTVTATAGSAIALSSTTASGDTTTAAVINVSGLMLASTDSLTVTFFEKSKPAGAASTAHLIFAETTTAAASAVLATVGTVKATELSFTESKTATNKFLMHAGTAAVPATGYTGAKFLLQVESTTASVLPGTYTYTVVVNTYTSNGATVGTTAYNADVNIVVGTYADDSKTIAPAKSTAYIQAGTTTGVAADAAVTAVATASNTARATIQVKTYNASSVAKPESITAVLTGSAGILCTDDPTPLCGTSLVIAGDGDTSIAVRSNGTAGTASIAISTTSVTFAPKTVTFYAKSPTTITASVNNPVLLVGSNTKAVKATAVDSLGNAWTGQLYIVASAAADALVGGSATIPVACSYDSVKAAHYCPVSTKTTGTASFKVVDETLDTDADDTTYAAADSAVTSAAVSVTVSNGAPTTVKLAFDKATYQPFEKATITVTVLDSAGKTLQGQTFANLLAAGGITSTQAFGSTSDTLTAVSLTTSTDASSTAPRTAGAYTYTVYMPAQGTVTISATGGTSLALAGQVAVSASATISNSAVDAATDAANEATDAANAATDAALAAADAADAATAAAQDASDAVAALSASVEKLVASLKAQLTSLTNLVIKIQKKVKA